MVNIIKRIYRKFDHLILYGIIGSFTASLDFIIYTILVEVFGVQYLVANCFSVLVGIISSFYLNRSFNFKVKDHTKKRFSIFLTIGLCGLICSNLLLYLLIDVMSMDKLISKLLSLGLVVFLQFLANKYITFKISNNG